MADTGQDSRGGADSQGAPSTQAPTDADQHVTALTSLSPEFIEEQHRTYVDRLNVAVKEPKNHNIALTGRYGAGKSSVLEKFVEEQSATKPPTRLFDKARARFPEEVRRRFGWESDRVLRLSISTLDHNKNAPGSTQPTGSSGTGEGSAETLTNRIQKELVKQLVYSAEPKTLRHSRFNRIIALRWSRALLEGAALSAALWLFLLFIHGLPEIAGTGDSHDLWWRIAAWAILGGLLAGAYAMVRTFAYNRFVVSDFSAGGATVKLSERTATYFDEYMDEIVHFFDTESPDIVVFEDLDRFSDPNIFEALREVNTTLNRTTHRRAKKVPLRFVYAVRDSLFEQLGADTKKERHDLGDAAAAETLRANRTKFFDVVIPIVPFISHRNARELLESRLEAAGIKVGQQGIERSLVALVAQHATDMRLLTNVTNEYLVFAQRLLTTTNRAPGLTPSKLFALVAYKNFHLGDFENIARSASALDSLNELRRDLVRANVERMESEQRSIKARQAGDGPRAKVAQQLAERLQLVLKTAGSSPQFKVTVGTADGTSRAETDFDTYAFWGDVVADGTLSITGQRPGYQAAAIISLDQVKLKTLFPEAFDAHRWHEVDEADARTKLERIDEKLRELRGADFADLVKMPDYKLALSPEVRKPQGEEDGSPSAQSFAQLIDQILESELACDLVKRGHVDRNFTLYAAQFYGTFSGVDVATFIVQNVQTNTKEIDYLFTSPSAIPHLLEEAGEDFTHTVAAYNNAILDHLLEHGDSRTSNIVNRLVSEPDDDATSFMASYFTSGKQRTKFAAALAGHPWTSVFTHLVSGRGVPEEKRPELLSAALLAANASHQYDLDGVAEFITDRYKKMKAFTTRLTRKDAEIVARLLDDTGVVIPKLAGVQTPLLDLVISDERYDLTARNLLVALERGTAAAGRDAQNLATKGVGLDRIRALRSARGGHSRPAAAIADAVYGLCLRLPDRYLNAVETDKSTGHAISTADTLTGVLADIGTGGDDESDTAQGDSWAEHWSDEQIAHLLALTNPKACLDNLEDAPTAVWTALAGAHLFAPNLTNVEAYLAERGSFGAAMGSLLTAAGTISGAPSAAPTSLDEVAAAESEAERAAVVPTAIAILNTGSIDTSKRVELARGLNPQLPLPVDGIAAEQTDLFARLLVADLVADDQASFTHFRQGGWASMAPAITASKHFTGLDDTEAAAVLEGMVADVFSDAVAAAELGRRIVSKVEVFVPEEDVDALLAIASFAQKHDVALAPSTIARVAATSRVGTREALRLLTRARPPATANEVVAVFSVIGEPYRKVTTSGEKFQLPKDDTHERLLDILREANVVERTKRRLQDVYDVVVK